VHPVGFSLQRTGLQVTGYRLQGLKAIRASGIEGNVSGIKGSHEGQNFGGSKFCRRNFGLGFFEGGSYAPIGGVPFFT